MKHTANVVPSQESLDSACLSHMTAVDSSETVEVGPPIISKSGTSDRFLLASACLSDQMEAHLWTGELGDRWDCPAVESENSCMFMGLYLSYDSVVRDILRDGYPESDPMGGFKACNMLSQPGKNGKGKGYDASHLERFLGKLHREGKIKGYKCSLLKRHRKKWNPCHFITLDTHRRSVGSRYLLFGHCPKRDWWLPGKTLTGKKRHVGLAKLEDCVYPLKARQGTAADEDVWYHSIDTRDRKYSKDSVFVMKQEAEMYVEVTSTGSFRGGGTWGHACVAAIYPADSNTSKHWWRHTGMVPLLFDNGKDGPKEFTAANMMQSIYGVYKIYSISIDV